MIQKHGYIRSCRQAEKDHAEIDTFNLSIFCGESRRRRGFVIRIPKIKIP